MKTINFDAIKATSPEMASLIGTFKGTFPDYNLRINNNLNNLRNLLKGLDDRKFPRDMQVGKFIGARKILTRFIELKENMLAGTARMYTEKDELYKALKAHQVITDEWEYPELAAEGSTSTISSTRQRTDELMNDTALAHHRF